MRNYTQTCLMLSFLVCHCPSKSFYSLQIKPGHLSHLKVTCVHMCVSVCECCVFTSSQAVIHTEHLSSNTTFGICGFGNRKEEKKKRYFNVIMAGGD